MQILERNSCKQVPLKIISGDNIISLKASREKRGRMHPNDHALDAPMYLVYARKYEWRFFQSTQRNWKSYQ